MKVLVKNQKIRAYGISLHDRKQAYLITNNTGIICLTVPSEDATGYGDECDVIVLHDPTKQYGNFIRKLNLDYWRFLENEVVVDLKND